MESGPKSEENVSYSSITAKKAQLQSMLSALLDDPILLDVPRKPTVADVDTLINLELGSAMKITISKMDNTSFDVAVLNIATVNDLKLAIRKKVNEMEQEKMGHRHISWRHVWANFCLSHHNEKLVYENSLLSKYGIRNNSKGLKLHFKAKTFLSQEKYACGSPQGHWGAQMQTDGDIDNPISKIQC